ncbi:MAG: MaoC family dehydratase [Bacteroidota bacterium]
MKIPNLAALADLKDKPLGPSEWVTITQDMINAFSMATLDDQWIHTDVARAKKESPFGTPIAHGFLSLSLLSYLVQQLIEVESAKMGLNYGLNKVRFTSHVPAGSRVRLRAKLIALEPYQASGAKMTIEGIMEREGSEKPVCVAEFLGLIFE